MDNYLIHFGNKNSGRYPRGSGKNPHQHDGLKNIYNLNRKQRRTIDKNLTNYRNKDITDSNVDSLIRDLNRKSNISRNVNELSSQQSFQHTKKVGNKVVDALLVASATVLVKDLLSENSTIRKSIKNKNFKNIFKMTTKVGDRFNIKNK